MIKNARELSTQLALKVNSLPRKWRFLPISANVPAPSQASTCVLCLAPTQGSSLCPPCQDDLPHHPPGCPVCGRAVVAESATVPMPCVRCREAPPAFHRLIAPFEYRFPVDALITRYKFGRGRAGGRLLAGQLASYRAQCTEPLPSLIIPCPMHRKRLYARGFDQTAELACWVGEQLNIPVNRSLCVRVRHTRHQVGQSREARLRNLEAAFAVRGQPPVHIAILDDVITTGATLQALASLLQAAGAERIEVWALARTPDRASGQ